jgi:hypothetical protein
LKSRFVEDFGIKVGFELLPLLPVLGEYQGIFALDKGGADVMPKPWRKFSE